MPESPYLRQSVSDAFNGARSAAISAFDGIRNGIRDRINSARDAVSNAISAIRSALSGTISFPHINLPHFSVYGGVAPYGIGGKGSLPSISVSWYAKGGVFSAPTLIGVGEGSSSEAVLPLNDVTYGAIARGISSRMASQGVTNIYYIDGNLVAADARLASALDVVAECVGGRRRMGTVMA